MTPRQQAAVLRGMQQEWEGFLRGRPGATTGIAPTAEERDALEAGAWALDLTARLIDTLTRSTPEEVHSAAREFAVLAGCETAVLSTLPDDEACRRDHTRRALRYGLAELALHAVARAMEATPAEVAP